MHIKSQTPSFFKQKWLYWVQRTLWLRRYDRVATLCQFKPLCFFLPWDCSSGCRSYLFIALDCSKHPPIHCCPCPQSRCCLHPNPDLPQRSIKESGSTWRLVSSSPVEGKEPKGRCHWSALGWLPRDMNEPLFGSMSARDGTELLLVPPAEVSLFCIHSWNTR